MGQSLINKPANYNLVADPTSCPTATPEVLINPSAPSESLMIKKIMGTFACGVKMPNTNRVLTQAELDCFVDWVNGVITESGGTVTTGGTPTAASTTTGGTMTSTVTTTSTTIGGTDTTGTVTSTSTSSTTGTATAGGEPPPPTWETMRNAITYSTIFCAASDCHGNFEGRLNLQDDEGLYTRLTTWTSELCGNKLVVNPGNPEHSAILDVFTTGCGDVFPKCQVGTECIPQMPIGCQPGFDCIAPEKTEAIRQWIANGAPP